MENMQAAAGKEPFVGIAGILAFQRGIQHGRQALVGALQQIIDRPAAQDIAGIGILFAQRFGIQHGIFLVQRFDNFQIGHQRSQFGGGTQVQLGALVDIQGLIETIGLNPKLGTVRSQLGKREAIDDLAQDHLPH